MQETQESAATCCSAAAAAAAAVTATGVVHVVMLPGEPQRGTAGALPRSGIDSGTTP